jgi:hypothetical protein
MTIETIYSGFSYYFDYFYPHQNKFIMSESKIELLQKQIEKLNHKSFDLEAWKKHTIIILEAIFGSGSQKIKQIENIEYEYNSWSLRDTSGYSAYLDSCKKLGREVLEASIEELEMLGAPESDAGEGKIAVSIVLDALDDELKGSQYKALMKLLKSNINKKEKARQVHDIIKELDNETVTAILEGIILHNEFVKGLN